MRSNGKSVRHLVAIFFNLLFNLFHLEKLENYIQNGKSVRHLVAIFLNLLCRVLNTFSAWKSLKITFKMASLSVI